MTAMESLSSLFSLDGKIIVVTGATGVLGAKMAKGLASFDAKVVVMGRDRVKAQQIANDIISEGGEAIWYTADVMDKDRLEEVRDLILKHWGRIDVLVNGAGGNLSQAIQKPDQSFLDLDTDGFKAVNELNLMGTVLPSQVFGQSMKASGKGLIVNISSVSAERTLSRVGGYGAAKAAVSHFTQWLAVDLARSYGEGIRVNAIMPGFFLTEQNQSLLVEEDGSLTARGKSILSMVPFARFGRPDELIGTLVWLCSEASAYVTGSIIPVDGGFTANGGI